MERAELGVYLRLRRQQLRPDDVGLVAGGRRRTPGLRRDEVALLANVSTDYYERIEQGRGPRPSPATLAGIARALRLDTDQRDHIYLLAGQPPPRTYSPSPSAEPALMGVLEALAAPVPALIADNLYTIVAQNPLNVALLGSLATAPGRRNNFLWRWFTDRPWRSVYLAEQHDVLGAYYVADLRAAVAWRGRDAAAVEFVTELSEASPEFRRIWDRHEVNVKRAARKVLIHPVVGRLDLECENVLGADSGQRLVLFRPQPGTGTDDRLEMLRELHQETCPDAARR
ncbi:helix-turn-helix domain-containing protein [Plantactinospora sonchi]|uniref:Helix-turn-helix transcriptional regulator n=1 Tax=Plantactinospora sonchi TaxID=1544735 RepID=A0ABU7RQI8_9ACTN